MYSLKNIKLYCIDTFFINKPTKKEIIENELYDFFLRLKKKVW